MKKIILLLVILTLCSYASANPTADNVSIISADGEHGEIVLVPVNITNVLNGPIQSIKLDILYDHSILELDYDNDDVILNGDLTTGYNWTFIMGTNEQSITLATSNRSQAIQNGSAGSVVLLNFTVIGTARETTLPELSDIEFSDPSGYNLGTAPAINGTFTVYKLGDINSDGNITSADALIALRMAVRGEYSKIADINSDGNVTSLDALVILSLITMAAADPVMTVSQQPVDAGLNDTFTAEVTVNPADSEIYAVSYSLYFNSTILKAIDQTQEDFLSQGSAKTYEVVNRISNTVGRIEYGETRIGDPDVVGYATEPGVLASITFEVIGEGMSTLTLSNVNYVKPEHLNDPEPTPEPTNDDGSYKGSSHRSSGSSGYIAITTSAATATETPTESATPTSEDNGTIEDRNTIYISGENGSAAAESMPGKNTDEEDAFTPNIDDAGICSNISDNGSTCCDNYIKIKR